MRIGFAALMLFFFANCFAIGCLAYHSLTSADSQPLPSEPCLDEATRERIRTLTVATLDEALQNHVRNLFEVWMRDDRDQPQRAQVGTQRGIKAYLAARVEAMTWTPPICKL